MAAMASQRYVLDTFMGDPRRLPDRSGHAAGQEQLPRSAGLLAHPRDTIPKLVCSVGGGGDPRRSVAIRLRGRRSGRIVSVAALARVASLCAVTLPSFNG